MKKRALAKEEPMELSVEESTTPEIPRGQEIQRRTSGRRKARDEKRASAETNQTQKTTSTEVLGGQEIQRKTPLRKKARVEKRASAERTQTQKSTSTKVPRGEEIQQKTSVRGMVYIKGDLGIEALLSGISSSTKIPVQRRTSGRRKPEPGADLCRESNGYIEPDRGGVIRDAEKEARQAKKASDKKFEELETMLRNCAADQDYHSVLQKVFKGEITEERIIEEIGHYIEQKLSDIRRYFCILFRYFNWDKDFIGRIAKSIQEVTEHLGVEVEELKDISLIAQDYCVAAAASMPENDSPFVLEIMQETKFVVVRSYVLAWNRHNAPYNGGIKGIEDWIKKPKPRFKSDNGSYIRDWVKGCMH